LSEKDRIWGEWLLGVFGTAGLFAVLAGIGMGAQHEKMGWMAWVLGSIAFALGPFFTVRIFPSRLSGGVAGVGMAIGAMAVLLIFASIYDVEIPLLAVVGGLFLGFLGGSLGEPWMGATDSTA
jgi:hypothetical protein